MPQFALGLNQDHPDRARLFYPQPFDELKLGVDDPPPEASIDDYAPDDPDQNGVGACVMCGVPYAAATTLAANGTPLPFRPSVWGGYATALGLERARSHPVGKLPALRDTGLELATGVRAISQWGVTAMGPLREYNGEIVDCDCTPGNFDDEVDLDTLIEARHKLIVGAYEITATGDIDKAIQRSIASRRAVAQGGFISDSFFRYGPGSDPIGAQDFNDPDGGGHCTYITKYKRPPVGDTLYWIRNSWLKRAWGINGCAWVTSKFVQQMWSMWTLDVRLVTR